MTSDDLFQYATTFLVCDPEELREPATAVAYAKQAVEKSGGKDAETLDLLARAQEQNGDLASAAAAEQRALALFSAPGAAAAQRGKYRDHLAALQAKLQAKLHSARP